MEKPPANNYHYTELKIDIRVDTCSYVERGKKVQNLFFQCIAIGILIYQSEGVLVIWKETILGEH